VHFRRATDSLSPRVLRNGSEEASFGEVSIIAELNALRADLAAKGEPTIGLVIIDTVRASMLGSEDSSEQVSAYLRVIRRILSHVPEAAAILAHHAGWQDGQASRKRERGSSALRGTVTQRSTWRPEVMTASRAPPS